MHIPCFYIASNKQYNCIQSCTLRHFLLPNSEIFMASCNIYTNCCCSCNYYRYFHDIYIIFNIIECCSWLCFIATISKMASASIQVQYIIFSVRFGVLNSDQPFYVKFACNSTLFPSYTSISKWKVSLEENDSLGKMTPVTLVVDVLFET